MPISQYTFPPPADGSMSPKKWYQSTREKPGFVQDDAQASAIDELDVLWHQLVDFKARRNQFLGRSLLSPDVPTGLYLLGDVGRGKSFLMDVFYACVPYKRKRRLHFHNFMDEVHKQMKQLEGTHDPLISLADSIEKSTRLLCFDEFHVNDIADAMILGRLLTALFERGVVMLITSNYAPDQLYLHGLQRQKFLPAIDLLKKNLKIIKIANGNDYRLREISNAPLFMLNSDDETEERMHSIFMRLGHGIIQNTKTIQVKDRLISVKKLAENQVWFDFKVICGSNRSQSDYLEIARIYPTVFISDIPSVISSATAEIQRFIWLIDVLYDHRVKLVASSVAPHELLSQENAEFSELTRTISRLIEMQSNNYLQLQHQTEQKTFSQHEEK